MNTVNRILAITISFSLTLLIFELVRRKKLKEKYAILWIFSGIIILILAISEQWLIFITTFFGIQIPANTVFFFGIFFILLINIHFSLVISNLTEQNKKIVQKLAILEAGIRNCQNNK